MTEKQREHKKTQFGKDAKEARDRNVHADASAGTSKIENAKLLDRPRSAQLKYTGSAYPKLLAVGTGELKKLASSAEQSLEGKAVKLSAEISRLKQSGEIAKPQSASKPSTQLRKPSVLEGLTKYKEEAQQPEADKDQQIELLQDNNSAPTAAADLRIDYPDGTSRQLYKSSNGELVRITFENMSDNYRDSWIRVIGANLWEQFDGDGHKTGKVFTGEITLDEEGNLTYLEDGADKATVETPEGGRWTFYKGGPGVYQNRAGLIAEVDYPNQTHAWLQYDNDGALLLVQFPDGVRWRRFTHDEWLAVDESGTPVDPDSRVFFGDIVVSDDGSLEMIDTAGNTAVVNPDGSRTTFYNDGSLVETNSSGQVFKVIYPWPKEATVEFLYHEGKLSAINHGHGAIWKHLKSDEWINHTTGERWRGSVNVNVDGSYTVTEHGQKSKLTENTNGSRVFHLEDGSSRVENSDGSRVKVDPSGSILSIDYPQGQRREFGYKSGFVVEVKYYDPETQFGDSWRRTGDQWLQYQDGKATGKVWYGEIHVEQTTGEFIYQSKGTSEISVEKADGSVLTLNESGLQDIRDPEGNELKFTRDESGAIVSFIDNETDGVWRSDDGHRWRNDSGAERIGTAQASDDGTFSFRQADHTTYRFSNGTSMELQTNRSRCFYDSRRRLRQAIDVNRNVYRYSYADSGKLNGISLPGGETWQTNDGTNWTGSNNQTWTGTAEVGVYGELIIFDNEKHTRKVFRLDGNHSQRHENPQSTDLEPGEISGKHITAAPASNEPLFHGRLPSSKHPIGHVKVHINARTDEDLTELQTIVDHALTHDAQLQSMVIGWKSLHPPLTATKAGELRKHSGADAGQVARLFTIYVKNADDAFKIQQCLKDILCEHLPAAACQPHKENQDNDREKTYELSVVRHWFEKPNFADVFNHAKLDDEVSQKIINDRALGLRAAAGRKSIVEQLEDELGLAADTLHTDEAGHFALSLSPSAYYDFMAYENEIYVQEGCSATTFGKLTDRAAMYAIYTRFGIDPAGKQASEHDCLATSGGTAINCEIASKLRNGKLIARCPIPLHDNVVPYLMLNSQKARAGARLSITERWQARRGTFWLMLDFSGDCAEICLRWLCKRPEGVFVVLQHAAFALDYEQPPEFALARVVDQNHLQILDITEIEDVLPHIQAEIAGRRVWTEQKRRQVLRGDFRSVLGDFQEH